MKFFAIQYLPEPTKFLPGYEGRGHTFREPTHWWIINPRLFMTRAAAARALGFWLKGHWRRPVYTDFDTGYEDEGHHLRAYPVEGRRREDFKIVEVDMTIRPASDPARR